MEHNYTNLFPSRDLNPEPLDCHCTIDNTYELFIYKSRNSYLEFCETAKLE